MKKRATPSRFVVDDTDRAYAKQHFEEFKARAHYWLERGNRPAYLARCRAMMMMVAMYRGHAL